MVKVGMAAGEASGDMLAGLLLGGLHANGVALETVGIGGPKMAAHGFRAWWSYQELAVRGYVEVLRHYWRIIGIRKQLLARLLADPPGLFIGVDAPDFNLDLERDLRASGVKTVHFVSPSIWAWRPERIEKIRSACDHVLCIFPFEVALYEAAGIPATYVGHPLADVYPLIPDRRAARQSLGLSEDGPLVALLPGSRTAEIKFLMADFLAAAVLIHSQKPATRFVIPAAPGQLPLIKQAVARAGLGRCDWIHIVDGQSGLALTASDCTIIASGTATLEAALAKCPMVIAYKMPTISWWIMRRKRLQPWVGLPNILANRFIAPELLQSAVTPDRLAHEALRWLSSPAEHHDACIEFDRLHRILKMDTATVASHAIQKILAS